MSTEPRRQRHLKRMGFGRAGLVAVLMAALVLSGCASGRYGSDGRPLTPAQRQLRAQTDRFNETVATGAVTGALIGAVLGALLDSNNRGQGAALGAAAGGLVGGASGYYIASENEQYASREEAANARASAADREADSYAQIANSAAKVAAENRAKIAALQDQYQKGQISAKQYAQSTRAMKDDLDRMDEALKNANDVRAKIGDDLGSANGSDRQTLNQSRAAINHSADQLQQSRDDLARALASTPEG